MANTVTDQQMLDLTGKGQATGSLADRQYAYLLGANPRTNSRNDLLFIKSGIPMYPTMILVT